MHAIDETYGVNFDFPFREQSPTVDYVLASLLRSGSTFIAMSLCQTGIMGAPMEYLNKLYMKIFSDSSPPADQMDAYWRGSSSYAAQT